MAIADAQLLQEFIQSGAENAFRLLVKRYADLVHGAALRQVRDAHLADEVTQAVFIVLARKASSAPPGHLPGWLLTVTRYCANNVQKVKSRRAHHERQAAAMKSAIQQPQRDEPTYEDLAPYLDEALSKLSEVNRSIIALRFLQNKPLGEVGATLGISENAVQKRLARALGRLRKFFTVRGMVFSTAAIIGSVLTTASSQSAPAALVNTAATAALAAAGGKLMIGNSNLIAKGAITMMKWTQVKFIGTFSLAILLTGAAGTSIALKAMGQGAPPVAATPAPNAAAVFSKPNALRSVALKAVTAVLCDGDAATFKQLVAADAEFKDRGKGTLLTDLRVPPARELEKVAVARIEFFEAGDVDILANEHHLQNDVRARLSAGVNGGLGALVVMERSSDDPAKPKTQRLLLLVVKEVEGRPAVVMADEEAFR